MIEHEEQQAEEGCVPARSQGRVRANEVLRLILEGTVAETGRGFFRALVRNLCLALQTHGAWVTEYLPEERRLRSLALWMAGAYVEGYEYDIAGTPCEPVIAKRCLAHFPDRVFSLFPGDPDLARFGAVSYVGVPLFDVDGGLLGHLAALDTKPMPAEPHLITVFEIFAERAAAEYRRLRTEERVLAREDDLRLLSEETEFLRQRLREAPEEGEILGMSIPMRDLLGCASRVAATDTTVLILGETGTGKELVARSIHAGSRRRGKPLVRVNCAAIPGSLMESELFGHEKGAFTGATMRREGRFALADGGTIFLDEVGELPLDLQAKLLRVLQEGEFEPLGSATTRKVDVRVIAATNRHLEEMVRGGTFREDLYYRLAVFPLRVPALRERGEDVGVLAAAFAERFARRMGRRVEPLSSEDIRRLSRYAWPGNVRELQNVIERAIILSAGTRLEFARVLSDPTNGGEKREDARRGDTNGGGKIVPSSGVEEGEAPIWSASELEALERGNMIRALERSGWKVAGEEGAARLLGLPPSTLSSRMRALGIRRPGH